MLSIFNSSGLWHISNRLNRSNLTISTRKSTFLPLLPRPGSQYGLQKRSYIRHPNRSFPLFNPISSISIKSQTDWIKPSLKGLNKRNYCIDHRINHLTSYPASFLSFLSLVIFCIAANTYWRWWSGYENADATETEDDVLIDHLHPTNQSSDSPNESIFDWKTDSNFGHLHEHVINWFLNSLDPSIRDTASQFWKMVAGNNSNLSSRSDYPSHDLDPIKLLSSGHVNEAISIFQERLACGEDRQQICKYLAISYILQNKLDLALPLLNEAIWLEPHDPELHIQRGYMLTQQELYTDAWLSFEKALILDPSRSNDIHSARNAVLKKLDIDVNTAYYHYALGTVYYELGFYDKALDCYQTSISLNPKYAHSLHNIKVIERILTQQQLYESSGMDIVPGRFLPIVTSYEYATMAEASYTSLAKAFPPSDWKRLFSSDDFSDENGTFSRDGFYAVIYANQKKKHIVLALQGSKATEDIISSIHLLFDCFDRQVICAKQFFLQARDRLNQDPELRQYDLSFTGHSLGAVQAEILASLFDHEAVTFESPGSRSLISNIKKQISSFSSSTSTAKMDLDQHNPIGLNFLWSRETPSLITAYLPRPNIINTGRDHVGKLIRIYPPLPAKKIRAENAEGLQTALEVLQKLLNVVPGLESFASGSLGSQIIKLLSETELMVLETAHWHSMANICQLLRGEYETGIPVLQNKVLKWPNTSNFYLYWRVTRDCITGEPDDGNVGLLNAEALKFANYQVEPSNMNVIPMAEFTRDEQTFLRQYKLDPNRIGCELTDLDKRLLEKYDIQSNQVLINVGISPEHWIKFVRLKARQMNKKSMFRFLDY